MNNSNSSYDRLELILSMIYEYNLSHLVEDDKNYSHLHNILESNFPWPLDMRLVIIERTRKKKLRSYFVNIKEENKYFPYMVNRFNISIFIWKLSNRVRYFTKCVITRFTSANVLSILVYSIQLVVGLVANVYALIYLLKERLILHNKNRMILLLIHLTCADLVVILVGIPLEISWTATVSWWADWLSCKVLVYLRIFGYLISGNILMAISLDRLLDSVNE